MKHYKNWHHNKNINILPSLFSCSWCSRSTFLFERLRQQYWTSKFGEI